MLVKSSVSSASLPFIFLFQRNSNDSKRLAEFDIFMEPAWKQSKKN